MRHLRVINHLGRTSSHRKAMLSNMATSLILHKRITTTTAKAKALRTFVEPLITKSKEDSTHSRRVVFGYLKDKTAVAELFREVSPKVAERQGGYTRILKIGNRIGDNADMCVMELVDYNEAMLGGEAAKTKTTRRRRAPKKKDDATAETKTPKAPKAKAEKSEKPVEKTEETSEKSVPEKK
jgi:large subunit ribosomal protein L17